MGKKRATQTIEIEATPQECFDAITDYDNIVDWQSAAESAEVLDYHEDGKGKTVQWLVDAKVKKVKYQLEYHYEEPGYVTWDFLEGDVKELEGSYRFEESNGGTVATFELNIDPGVWIPGPIARTLNDQVMTQALKDLKSRVEGLKSGKEQVKA